MANNIKTKISDASVEDFINSVDSEAKRQDAFTLLKIYTDITGEQAKMWGTSIIGFGQYHYKSEHSKQEGDWPLAGFSPRKQNLTLYVMHDLTKYSDLLAKLGKYKTSVSCVYINKLIDIDMSVLKKLIQQSYTDAKKELLL